MEKLLVTAYKSPDLDGSGGAYAYAELLNATGKSATAAIFGHLRREAQFAFDKVGAMISSGEDLIDKTSSVILVDSCEIKGIAGAINPEQVIEVIDHRRVNEAKKEFPNAKIQIELVGSCATLIVEKFINSKIVPTKISATLLYLAIVSNTINFKNKVTTKRDIEAASYLKELYSIDENLIHEMFVHQSNLQGPVKAIFQRDKWSNEILGKVFSIYQFEIVDVDNFIKNNLVEIKEALIEVQNEGKFDFVLLTCIDLEKAENTFVVPDDKTGRLIGEILNVKFVDNVSHYPEIIMRKEIMPKIKEYFKDKQ